MSAPQQINSQVKSQSTQPEPLRIMATIISWICHPVFFPLIMTYVIYKLEPGGFIGLPPKQMGLWFINIGMTAVFFPLFSILLMKQLGFISSYQMPTARERTIPLMATMIFYFWISHVFNSMGVATVNNPNPPPAAPLIYKVLLLGNLWGIIALFMINIFTKISLHTTAAGGMIGILVVMMLSGPANLVIALFTAIIVAGIIGSARMILGAHQRGDLWLGYIIGFLAQLLAWVYMR